MKIIAIEEAFSIDELETVPGVRQYPGIDPKIMGEWEMRLPDFRKHRLPDMDTHGVHVQVLSLTSPGIQAIADAKVAVASAIEANNHLARIVARAPGRFAGFATLPLQDPEAAAAELRRCIEQLNFCGALVNDTTLGKYLDDPSFGVVWKALEDLDVPLYLHPGARVDDWSVLQRCAKLSNAVWEWQAQVGGHAMRLLFNGVFDRHPNAKIIIGHMGEFLPFQIARFDSRYLTHQERNLKRLPSEYFGLNIFISTSGVCSAGALIGALKLIGDDAILFAIGYPFEKTEPAVRFLKTVPISESTRQKIAAGNAERLLKLRKL